MTTGQELFADMVRAKIRREDQAAEIEQLRAARDGLIEAINDALLFDAWDPAHAKDRLRSAVEQWSGNCDTKE